MTGYVGLLEPAAYEPPEPPKPHEAFTLQEIKKGIEIFKSLGVYPSKPAPFMHPQAYKDFMTLGFTPQYNEAYSGNARDRRRARRKAARRAAAIKAASKATYKCRECNSWRDTPACPCLTEGVQ